ncbi:MAG: cysteine--tRNA ligase [Caldiserica bacterium]|nr:MAG: cysteine--tRNA ligase [Caldisericota bacterium]
MIRVYNTLTRKKEELVPREKGKIYMYVCGLTPDNYPHLGHARAFVVFDTIKRYLKFKGFEVKYVQNYTDIDDKIIKRANEWGISPKEIAETFISMYEKYLNLFNVDREGNIYPRVTENIDDIIKMIKELEDKGFAYETDTGVYFSVKKFPEYGKLSRRKIEDLIKGARIPVDETKKDPLDFALWKKQKPGEPAWNSPWGKGRPGWHIECSVMSMKYLGFSFDIHGGGIDLIFPHHENEIAQSEAWAGDKPYVRYWLHNGLITVNKEKMSKSLGNFFTIEELLKKYQPEVLRLFLLSGDYHSPIDFSFEKLNEIKKSYERIKEFYNFLKMMKEKFPEDDEKIRKISDDAMKEFTSFMDDDFNTQGALGVLFKFINKIKGEGGEGSFSYALKVFEDMLNILGIKISFKEIKNLKEELIKILSDFNLVEKGDEEKEEEELIKKIIDERKKMRENKEYEKADKIRDRLKELGYEVRDGKRETIYFRRE